MDNSGLLKILDVVLKILTLLFGSGFIYALVKNKKLKKEQRIEKEKNKVNQILNELLIPIQFTLQQNKRIHDELLDELDLQALEYAPDYIKKRIDELYDNSPSRNIWFSRIKTIIENNQKCIDLIHKNVYLIENKELSGLFTNFVHHAQGFNDIWRQIQSADQIQPGINDDLKLYSDQYPQNMDQIIEKEIYNLKNKRIE